MNTCVWITRWSITRNRRHLHKMHYSFESKRYTRDWRQDAVLVTSGVRYFVVIIMARSQLLEIRYCRARRECDRIKKNRRVWTTRIRLHSEGHRPTIGYLGRGSMAWTLVVYDLQYETVSKRRLAGLKPAWLYFLQVDSNSIKCQNSYKHSL